MTTLPPLGFRHLSNNRALYQFLQQISNQVVLDICQTIGRYTLVLRSAFALFVLDICQTIGRYTIDELDPLDITVLDICQTIGRYTITKWKMND